MLDEGTYEKLAMAIDGTLSSIFKGYVSKWEPFFFHFLVIVAFFVVGYMITTLLFKCSMSIRPKN
jgi:hypothetical protein